MPEEKKPNIRVIWGDDIGISNLGRCIHGLTGTRTPNIEHLAEERMMFTDGYGDLHGSNLAFVRYHALVGRTEP